MKPDAYIVYYADKQPRLTFHKPEHGTYMRLEFLFKRRQLNQELEKRRKELRNAR